MSLSIRILLGLMIVTSIFIAGHAFLFQAGLSGGEDFQQRFAELPLYAALHVLGSGIVAEGLAALPDGRVLAVDGDTLAAFGDDGAVLERWTLTGIEDASGLAIDPDGRLLVTDRADLEIRAFSLDDL